MRRILLLLAGSVALMMTGYGIVFPIFGKRLGELGAGVETLGSMSMAFAVAQLLLAPVLGSATDRFGRRPIILLALVGFAMANVGFLLVDSPGAYALAALVALAALSGHRRRATSSTAVTQM
jgi:MYXO-CTERM domain-containing protein